MRRSVRDLWFLQPYSHKKYKPKQLGVDSGNLLSDYQFSFRDKLGICDALLTLLQHVQASLDAGSEDRLAFSDIYHAFDVVIHKYTNALPLVATMKTLIMLVWCFSCLGQFYTYFRLMLVTLLILKVLWALSWTRILMMTGLEQEIERRQDYQYDG